MTRILSPHARLILLAVTVIPLLAMTGCGDSENTRAASNTFYYNENDQPKSLDPVQINNRAAWWVGGMVYLGLVQLDSDLNPVPAIASAWESDSTGRIWTFHLRNDIRFADDPAFPDGKGRVVTAEDVRFSFERVCDPRTTTTGFWIFRGKVRGAEEYYASHEDGDEEGLEHVSGFRVVDDTTFVIELNDPFPPFLTMLSIPFAYVVPKEAVERYGDDFFRNPVGAGPFRVADWVPDERLILVRNPSFHESDEQGNRLPYLDSVWISFVGEGSTVFSEFRQGRLDLLVEIEPTYATQVLQPDGESLKPEFSEFSLHSSPALSTEYYGFMLDETTEGGQGSPLADNVHLRRAINYAIDRQRITRFVLHGQAMPAVHGPVPPAIPGFSGVEGYRYDRDLAARLLDTAGYPAGRGLPPLTLQLGTDTRTGSVAEAVQEDLRKVGIEIELRQVEFGMHLGMVRDGKLPMWRTSWIGDYPDAENFLALFYSEYAAPAGPNTTRYSNRRFDSLYRAALEPGLSIEKRAAIYAEAERTVIDDAPWVFLYYNVVQQLTQPWIVNYSTDPLQRLNLTRVRKTQNS